MPRLWVGIRGSPSLVLRHLCKGTAIEKGSTSGLVIGGIQRQESVLLEIRRIVACRVIPGLGLALVVFLIILTLAEIMRFSRATMEGKESKQWDIYWSSKQPLFFPSDLIQEHNV